MSQRLCSTLQQLHLVGVTIPETVFLVKVNGEPGKLSMALRLERIYQLL